MKGERKEQESERKWDQAKTDKQRQQNKQRDDSRHRERWVR